ncbi:hypothetical protein ARMSODRAFT_1027815 [Armillaria solidipes]|uniref:Uncharacterized protein n=1 Tax=Armillaria solidipes TaxID=1076256 RepID=A0A2H3AJ67_9AGAR|nr:hypothetical protein ARMSODRAFT_1027815 [Armillaria solidipes]
MNRKEWLDYYSHDVNRNGQGGREHFEKMRLKYAKLPKVTLSTFTEAGEPESSISVPKQRSYTGREPVISSSLANTRCTSLSVKRLLRTLNSVLNTSYTMEIRSLYSLLKGYIMKDYDFGTVYGHLRPFWYKDLTDIEHKLQSHEARDGKMRRDVLVNNKIINPLIPP